MSGPKPGARYYARFTAHGARLFSKPYGDYVGTIYGDFSLTTERLGLAGYQPVAGYYTVRVRDDGGLETADGPVAIRLP